MRILFDQGTPVPPRQFLTQPEITTAFECGWSNLKNGELLIAAEEAGFSALVTTDRSMKHQQNPIVRRIAVVVLSTPSWPRIQRAISKVASAIDAAKGGTFSEIAIP